jgi:hypothetical protein
MSELKAEVDPAEVGLDPVRLERIGGISAATSTTGGSPAG